VLAVMPHRTGNAGLTAVYGTWAAASAATHDSGVTAIYVAGKTAAGDNGGGWLVYTAGTPSHTGYITDAGGRKYKLNPHQVITPEHFGAVSDDSTDNTAAFDALATYINAEKATTIK